MHEIEPYYGWLKWYEGSSDAYSPFYGKEYNYDLYSENIYGYYIDPAWDFMGSETLYIKILYANYELGYVIIEMIGEWNDAINNDIMHLKRNIVDHLLSYGIDKYILIGENVLNFHGSDDCYYEEWFDAVVDDKSVAGWIAGVNFPDFLLSEFQQYNVDGFVNMGGTLQIDNWRTMKPEYFFEMVRQLVQRRIALV